MPAGTVVGPCSNFGYSRHWSRLRAGLAASAVPARVQSPRARVTVSTSCADAIAMMMTKQPSNLPAPRNEPVLDYAPGSAAREALKSAIAEAE